VAYNEAPSIFRNEIIDRLSFPSQLFYHLMLVLEKT
jgi:hypothetical protein